MASTPVKSSSSLLMGDMATTEADPTPELPVSAPEPNAANEEPSESAQPNEPPPRRRSFIPEHDPFAPSKKDVMSSDTEKLKSFSAASPMPSAAEEGFLCAAKGQSTSMLVLMVLLCVCAIIGVVELGSLIGTVSNTAQAPTIIVGDGSGAAAGATTESLAVDDLLPTVAASTGENVCAGANPNFPNMDCIVNGMTNVGPQAGANITKGFKGDMQVDFEPIKTAYWKAGLCPVNVHWHLGAEHYSLGEFDENGKGSREIDWTTDGATSDQLGSFQCHHYDETNPIFTRKYDWKHCIGMEVGQTYEVHWPHSAAGACGTPNQYQTPFYDGIFCNLDLETFSTLTPQQIARSVGVQGQVFTIVNDEQYFRPNLMRGMIVDGELGKDIAIYTGSSTGSSRSNTVCSAYSPVTWQVDRKCHLISASSFDLMCAEMKMQRDDMTYDLVAHGSRPLVSKELTADNQANRNRKLRGDNKN